MIRILRLARTSAFAGSAWLNGHFLGTSFGNSTNNLNIVATTNQTFAFPAGSLINGTNVVTVVVGERSPSSTSLDRP